MMFDGGSSTSTHGEGDEPLDPAASLAAVDAAQARVNRRLATAGARREGSGLQSPAATGVITAALVLVVAAALRWIVVAWLAFAVLVLAALVARGRARAATGMYRRLPLSSAWRDPWFVVPYVAALIVVGQATPEERWWWGVGLSPVVGAVAYARARHKVRQAPTASSPATDGTRA